MGAMTIVEIVDQNGGFNWVRKVMKTKSKRALLWRIAILTFFLSAILDNLTTSIVMIDSPKARHRPQGSHGLCIPRHHRSQFGWCLLTNRRRYHHHALEQGTDYCCRRYRRNLHPSVVSMVIPALILQTMLKGELVMPEVSAQQNASVSDFTEGQRKAVFWLGVGGLIFVPIFKSITHFASIRRNPPSGIGRSLDCYRSFLSRFASWS